MVFFGIVVISLVIVVLSWWKVRREKERKQERSQKIDDLPILATCQSGTLAMLSSKVVNIVWVC